MKSFTRTALLGAAGLVLLALPAHAQRPYDPSAGSVGFKKSKKKKKKEAPPQSTGPYNPNAGSISSEKPKK